MISKNPQLDNEIARQVLHVSSDDVGQPGKDDYFGYGRINAYKAVASIDNLSIGFLFPETNDFVKGNIVISGNANINDFSEYSIYYASEGNPRDTVMLNSSNTPVLEGVLGEWNTTVLNDGKYILTLIVVDAQGFEWRTSITVSIDNINEPPLLNLPPYKFAIIDRLLKFKIEASDPDDPNTPGGQSAFSVDGLPPNSQFDPVTQIFSWQPSLADKGTYFMTFNVKDDQHSVTKSLLMSTINIEKIQITDGSPYLLGDPRLYKGRPAIYEDKIVWSDWRFFNGDIFMYDLSAKKETQITTDSKKQDYPDIHRDKIVWNDDRTYDIYMYDLSKGEETQITNTPAGEAAPYVHNDRIIWEQWGYDTKNWDIYLYEIASGRKMQITDDPDDQFSASIYEDKIVFCGGSDSKYDIYMHDLSSGKTTQITYNPTEKNSTAIYDDKIVWSEAWGFSVCRIYLDDIATAKQKLIADYASAFGGPKIYEDMIVWEDIRDGKSDIYIYDLSANEEIQITDDFTEQHRPDIYKDKIVWEEWIYKGHPPVSEIFMGKIYIAPRIGSVTSQVVSFGASLTINGSNFGYTQGYSEVLFENGAVCPVETWSNTSITCRVPQDALTGLLKVETPGGLSNGVLVTVESNRPPVLNTIPDLWAYEGTYSEYPISAADPDGDKVSFSATGLPGGVSLADNGDNSAKIKIDLTNIYNIGRSEPYTARITVSDGSLPAAQEWKVYINNVPVKGTIYEKISSTKTQVSTGAAISLMSLDNRTLATYTTQDSDGGFYLAANDIPHGVYFIKVTKDGYKPYTNKTVLDPNQVSYLTVTLEKLPSCSLSGTVYVANGSIDTIKVELLKDNIMLIDTRHVPANGRYSFTQDIPVGTYKLKAAAPWGEVQEKTVSFTTQGESKTVDFNLTMPLPVAE